MPKRITFHVVYATSEDSSYPACELNSQGPAARGWRSLGAPPHELLLRLTSVSIVHKLQLLAHHQLIPSSVEVLVSGGLISEGAATPCGATYTSVGRVSLAKPIAEARTRELRSAALPEPTVARFVKLRLCGPHPPADECDQVALMAVNVLGEELEDESPPPFVKEPSYCPYDDLAFVMYVDTEIADLIRSLDEKKRKAVAEERFEYARRLKSAASALTSAGIRVGRWRLRKRIAAVRDDFELAKNMRDRVSDALVSVKEDSQLCLLFEEHGPNPRNDASMTHEYDFSHHLSPSVVSDVSMDVVSPVPPILPNRGSPVHIEEESLPHYFPEPQEEKDREQGINKEQIRREEIRMEDLRKEELRREDLMREELRREELRREELRREELRRAELRKDEFVREERRREEHKRDELRVEEMGREERKETDSPRRSITPNAANGGALVKRRNKSAGPRSTFEAYEERALPALRHSHTNEYLRDPQEEQSGSSVTSQKTHKLNDREKKQAALPILIFGYPLVEKFYSKNFLDKEEGLARLRAELSSPTNDNCKTSPNKTARAAAILLQRALRDKVFSVYSQANDVLKTLFQDFVPDRVCAAEVGRCLEKILPELLRACGDPAPRIHSTAQHSVLTIADCAQVRSLHVIPQQLVRPVTASMHPRLALSRLQMLEQLILSHGISTDKNSGLTVRRLAECGAAGAQHAAGSVRAAAERILLAAYSRSPRLVRAQLPPDDAVTRRNLIYRHLFQQFDRIDMQKMLNKAPSEEPAENDHDTASITQSTRSAATSLMTSSFATSSYSLKSLSSASGTLAPSSVGSAGSNRTKSSMKKTPTKRYTAKESLGYNKLRLDSAVSPKHSPKNTGDKVHFQESQDNVVYRRTNRVPENRHSMIHYDHDSNKPQLKERPITVYEPLHLDYREAGLASPKLRSERSMDSLAMDSPLSRNDLRCDSDRSLDSPKIKGDFFRDTGLESPRLVAGVRNLQLDETSQMDESGYYSPGRKPLHTCSDQFDGYETAAEVEATPEPVLHTTCTWCGRRIRADSVESHYWRRCVLLARCAHCSVALEARALHSHLLEECPNSNGAWKACKQCGAALRLEDPDYHVNCIPLGRDEWKCPYCLSNVLARDLPWQRHLMQCPRNPRLSSQAK